MRIPEADAVCPRASGDIALTLANVNSNFVGLPIDADRPTIGSYPEFLRSSARPGPAGVRTRSSRNDTIVADPDGPTPNIPPPDGEGREATRTTTSTMVPTETTDATATRAIVHDGARPSLSARTAGMPTYLP